MITITNLNLQFGAKCLFRDVSARINTGERIGLAGVNGAGKSTLLKMLAGLSDAGESAISRAKGTSVSYLPQEMASVPPDRTLFQEAETAFAETLAMRKEMQEVNRRLQGTDPGTEEFRSLLKRHGELQHGLDQADEFRITSEIEKVLMGLGFRKADLDRPCNAFSGGWFMRLMLSKLLLARPSLLLLDEPTNHLDIESLTWLEGFLKTYPGAMVIVSHDRAFLDNTTGLTWELSLGRLTAYKGNYSQYVEEKETRLRIQRAAHANQQARIQQTMRFVERFRSKATKASQVQSRLRQLEKMEKIELEGSEREIFFSFPPAAACGRLVLDVRDLVKSYDGSPVFSNVSFQLQRGDKLAVVGVNGAGKSTLARLLAGLERADGGEVRMGHNVRPSYYGQDQAKELSPELTVLETLSSAAGSLTVTGQRSLLGAFLFTGDDVEKRVRVLSGGEKSRLALARMIATPANLLILDEPTNHLDMLSQEVLQEAMAQYDGTIVVVSHNRYFLNRFINRVLEVKAGHATLFEGNLDDYLYRIQQAREETGEGERDGDSRVQRGEGDGGSRGKAARQAQARLRQEKSRLLAPFREATSRSETEIERLESRKTELERCMADPDLYRDEAALAGWSREYRDLERLLADRYREWEEALARIEEIESSFTMN
jgi:ATP-binding cassette subfamily F protein 3